MLRSCILFGAILLFYINLPAQNISLSGNWKFHTGDNLAWKAEQINEQDWQTIFVPSAWESSLLPNYDGYAWYRTTFQIPDNLLRQDWVLRIGAIDDSDETWLNGTFIGSTGKFPPDDQSAWDTPRNYVIPADLLKKQNTLAIRVYDGAGGGGIYLAPVELMPRKQYDKMLRKQRKQGRSYHQLTTTNGLIAAVYNTATHEVENVYPHIFSAYDSALFVQPYMSQLTLDSPEKPLSAAYVQNTHVIEVRYKRFTVNYFASFGNSDRMFYAVLRGDSAYIANLRFVYKSPDGLQVTSVFKKTGKQAEKYFLFGPADGDDLNHSRDYLAALQGSLADAEVAWMRHVFERCRFPEGLKRAERNLMEQSVAVLKMAQVADNEIFPFAEGQIMASLRPGVWSISWVRDAAFAIDALTRLGLYEEARKALLFMLATESTNQYKHYIHTDGKDYGIGVDYQISVTRYFGNGREESDFDHRGPNIEIDDFGLFLIALCNYVNASGDAAFFRQWQPVLQSKVADAIVHNINNQNIIRADSGPWEHHLPGRSYTFTSGVCGMGLEQFAALQQQFGYESDAYLEASKRLRAGILVHMLYDNRLLKGNASDTSPQDHYFYDAATFELFAGGFIRDKTLFLSHMQACDATLGVKTGAKAGYIRINSSDSYENQEWPFAGLRVAVAQVRFGNKAEAKRLVKRVTNIAGRNYNLIPEIITLDTESYKGSIPMAGYGAGAYVLAIFAVYE